MSWNFQAGMRVICLEAAWRGHAGAPQKGAIYTIAETAIVPKGTACFHPIEGRCLLAQDELFIKLVEMRDNGWWEACSFRPVDETRLDQFRAHLAPKDKARKAVDA